LEKIKQFQHLRIAVLGYNGIGKHHIQVLNKLGAKICGILTSSNASGIEAVRKIKDRFGIETKSYTDLSELIKICNPDAIHICTPDKNHFSNILEAFENNIPVFCEKPLFWNESINQEEVYTKISTIKNHPNRKIFMNTSNSSIIYQTKARQYEIEKIKSFTLEFSTNGNKKFQNIASDLLPHGLSMLQEVAGTSLEAKDFSAEYNENKYFCRFIYKNINVSFKFSECPHSEKVMIFTINSKRYQRIQSIKNQQIIVSILDHDTEGTFPIENPLEVFIRDFLEFCINPDIDKRDDFERISWNILMMSKLLLETK
jgi:hypothetical protein